MKKNASFVLKTGDVFMTGILWMRHHLRQKIFRQEKKWFPLGQMKAVR